MLIFLSKLVIGIITAQYYHSFGILHHSSNTPNLHILGCVVECFLQSMKLILSKLVGKESKEEKIVETF
jgi:hypothetical protein